MRPFTDKQIELVTTFADQAVIAIENVRLFDEVQARTRELSEALEQQTATSEVLQVISSSPGELEPVFEAMLANAIAHLRGQFRLCASPRATLSLVALHDAAAAACRGTATRSVIRPDPGRRLGRLARTKQIVHIADMQQTEPISRAIQRFALSSLAVLARCLSCRCSRRTS